MTIEELIQKYPVNENGEWVVNFARFGWRVYRTSADLWMLNLWFRLPLSEEERQAGSYRATSVVDALGMTPTIEAAIYKAWGWLQAFFMNFSSYQEEFEKISQPTQPILSAWERL